MTQERIFSKCFSQNRRAQGVTGDGKIDPARRGGIGKPCRIARIQPGFGMVQCKTRMQRRDAKRGPIEDCDGYAARNGLPIAPAVKLLEIIGPHEPHKLMLRVMLLQKADAIDGVVQVMALLDIAHADARVPGQHFRK